MKCGTSEINITPPLGLIIPGYLEPRISTGVKDDLFARSFVIEDTSGVFMSISLDLLCIDRYVVQAIRRKISDSIGLPMSNIMVSATHAHTGPPVMSRFPGPKEEEYIGHMAMMAAEAGITAYNSMKPARIGFGTGKAPGIAFNRRYFMDDGSVKTNPGIGNPHIARPAGPVDDSVTVIRIDHTDGRPMCVITNFACHPDVVSGTEYSADYPGELSRSVKKVLGQEVISIFLTGTCGNINHINVNPDSIAGPGHYTKMGRILADEVLKVRGKIECVDSISVNIKNKLLNLPVRHPTTSQFEEAEKTLCSETAADIEKFFANEMLMLKNDSVKSLELEVQTVSLGGLAITALPSEIFVEFGLDIKSRSPYKINIISALTNGINGYIPIREAFLQGGYETRIRGRNRLCEDTGYILVDAALNLLNNMHDDPG